MQGNIKPAGLLRECDERFRHILGYRRMASWINHVNHSLLIFQICNLSHIGKPHRRSIYKIAFIFKLSFYRSRNRSV